MNIKWAVNPLQSTISLNSTDYKLLKALSRFELLQDLNLSIIDDIQNIDLIKQSSIRAFFDSESERVTLFESQALTHFHNLLEALSSTHYGDCTAVAGPCIKCHAEEILETSTIKGLDKIAASIIQDLFESLDGKKLASEVRDLFIEKIIQDNPQIQFPEILVLKDILNRPMSDYNDKDLVRAFKWIHTYYLHWAY